MALKFINGGSNLLGELHTSRQSILNSIKDNLLLAGWTIPVNNINNTTTNNYFIGRGDNGLTQCWAKVSANATDIIVQGDWQGNNTILSSQWSIGKYTEGQQNRLYLCAENDFFSASIYDMFGDRMNGAFCGYPQIKLFPNDQGAWYSGQINSMGCVFVEVARHWATNNNWVSWEDVSFVSGSDWNASTSNSYPSQGTFDRFTTALKPYSNYLTNASNRAASVYAQNGSLNAVNQLAVLGPMYFVEGLATSTSYPILTYQGDNVPTPLPIKGFYNHLVVGAAYYNQRTIIEDIYSGTNWKYLSVGNRGFQGMRIA